MYGGERGRQNDAGMVRITGDLIREAVTKRGCWESIVGVFHSPLRPALCCGATW